MPDELLKQHVETNRSTVPPILFVKTVATEILGHFRG